MRLLSLVLVFTLAACEQRTDLMRPPPADTTGDGGDGGGVQRTTLVVEVTVSGEARDVAAAVGAEEGTLPGVRVTIQRSGESSTRDATTDSDGRASFPDLLPGDYTVALLRLLTEEESETVRALDDHLADVNAFGGGLFVQVEAPSDTVSVDATAGRRGSLVLSEVFGAVPRSGSNSYGFGHFVEIYNNADTVVHLDGKVLAFGLWMNHDSPETPCSLLEEWRHDPEGIWTEHYLAFPGDGQDHPLAPGEAAVVAMDAVDHREFWDGLPDLSEADFESIGSPDVDNQRVRNMIQRGPRPWDTALGHGMYVSNLHSAFVLAEGFDPGEVPHDDLPLRDPEHHRIPAELILDVATLQPTPDRQAALGVEFCRPMVAETFDRAPAQLLEEPRLFGIHREVLGTTEDARPILQRTLSSATDFHRLSASPGRVP